MLEVTKSAAQASEVVRAAWSQYKGKDNPDLRLLDLDKVAALIEADFPTRLYYVPLRNSLFDTHVNQAAPHDRQLEYCSDAIAGFFQEMKRIGRADDVVMYVHSEFGRRVPENTSLGTDHGTAQVNFVIGNAREGRAATASRRASRNLVLGDNLENTTDFRQVYATLIDGWLGADAAKVLGQKFETLKMFRGLARRRGERRWPLASAGLRDRRPGRTTSRRSPPPTGTTTAPRTCWPTRGSAARRRRSRSSPTRASSARSARSCTTRASRIRRCSRSSNRGSGIRR